MCNKNYVVSDPDVKFKSVFKTKFSIDITPTLSTDQGY